MTLKCLPAGNLLDYLESPRDYKGRKRPCLDGLEPTRWIGNPPDLVRQHLKQLAPPYVRQDRRRRWVGHCRRHLSHFILGFSEGYGDVAPNQPIALRSSECLLAAGLPLASLKINWCEHPLAQNSHVHGGLLNALLPAGGPYEPALDGELAARFSWLVSRGLGLSNPMHKLAARLIRGSEFSYRDDWREEIDEICAVVAREFNDGNVDKQEDFIRLLENRRLGRVLAAPGPDGRAELRPGQEAAGRNLDLRYRHMVALQLRSGPVIWLKGMACHFQFRGEQARGELRQRQEQFGDPAQVYRRFLEGLQERITAQKARYGDHSGQPLVGPQAFEWLDPARHDRRLLALDRMALIEEGEGPLFQLPAVTPRLETDPAISSVPEIAYPYYSDLRECRGTITDPRQSLGGEPESEADFPGGRLTFHFESRGPSPSAPCSQIEPAPAESPGLAPAVPATTAGPPISLAPAGSRPKDLDAQTAGPAPKPGRGHAPLSNPGSADLRPPRKRRRLPLRISLATALAWGSARQAEGLKQSTRHSRVLIRPETQPQSPDNPPPTSPPPGGALPDIS